MTQGATVGTVQVDYTITTYAQDVSDGDDDNAATDSVINSVQAASSDGTFCFDTHERGGRGGVFEPAIHLGFSVSYQRCNSHF